jgi:preprotein translocase subunit SecA
MASRDTGIPLIGPFLNKLIGSRNDRFVKKYTQRVEQISAESDRCSSMTDEEIRGVFLKLRDQHDAGAKEDVILAPAFATAREAMDRAVGLRPGGVVRRGARAVPAEPKPPFRARPFDVQLIGAMVLSQGKIAEMKTGEGKTIVAPLAAYLAAAVRRTRSTW